MQQWTHPIPLVPLLQRSPWGRCLGAAAAAPRWRAARSQVAAGGRLLTCLWCCAALWRWQRLERAPTPPRLRASTARRLVLPLPFSDAIQQAFRFFAQRGAAAMVLPEWVPTPDNLGFNAAVARLDQAVFGLIAERRRWVAGAGRQGRRGGWADLGAGGQAREWGHEFEQGLCTTPACLAGSWQLPAKRRLHAASRLRHETFWTLCCWLVETTASGWATGRQGMSC